MTNNKFSCEGAILHVEDSGSGKGGGQGESYLLNYRRLRTEIPVQEPQQSLMTPEQRSCVWPSIE